MSSTSLSCGSYFAPAGVTPNELGIGDYGRAWNEPGAPVAKKEPITYTFKDPNEQRYMQSTTSPIDDDWSVPAVGSSPAIVQPTSGGGTQYTIYDGCDPNYTGTTP